MAKSFDALVKRTTTKRFRDRAERRMREFLGELLLSELRRAAGQTQDELAAKLAIKQPSLSKLESQTDMQISTLQRIVAALGGELDVLAMFPNGTIRMSQFTTLSRTRPRSRGTAKAPRLF